MKKLIIQLSIPFCVKHCSYCTQKVCKYTPKMMRCYVAAAERDIVSAAEDMGEYEIAAISVEGGSPVLAEPSGLQTLLRALRKSFHLAEDVQISLQTMPGDYSRALMQRLPECGVNFWIFGVQTADMREHALLDRPYLYEAQSMVDLALLTFDVHKRSFELLYGIPGQSMHSFEHSLDSMLYYAPEHLTLMPLRLEEGTDLYFKCKFGKAAACSAEDMLSFYHMAQDKLSKMGYQQYTIQDFAKPGGRNRYRLEQLSGTEQLGIGYHALSRMEGLTWQNGHSLQEYLEHSDDISITANRMARLDDEIRALQELEAALFLQKGVDMQTISQRYGEASAKKAEKSLKKLEKAQGVCLRGGKWYLTDTGIVNSVLHPMP